MDRVYEVALQRLEMEQRKLRRVGVEIDMGKPWASGKDLKRSLALIKEDKGPTSKERDQEEAPLQVVQG